MPNRLVLVGLNDPHILGITKFGRIARDADFEVKILPVGSSYEDIFLAIQSTDATHVGVSYRMSPEVGLSKLEEFIEQMSRGGLLRRYDGTQRRIAFAGLPKTVAMAEIYSRRLPFDITLFSQKDGPISLIEKSLDYLNVPPGLRSFVKANFMRRVFPPRIELLDQIAEEVVTSDYMDEPPLPVPIMEARLSQGRRIEESPDGIIYRAHFGIPGDSIQPTIEGIRRIALGCVLDLISLGSSRNSQMSFGEDIEVWRKTENDGGVPYRTFEDLIALHEATQMGNYPAIKPYAHSDPRMADFVDTCIKAGYLIGGHQAIPLFWFDELDNRGPMNVYQAIKEHARAVRKLAGYGIPIEINDPNQWNSRWAHDSLVVADYGLITAFVLANGLEEVFVPQLQFNKPKETGDLADLAKMQASLDIINEMMPLNLKKRPEIRIQTRTGIGSFEPGMGPYQLARSTLQQMMIDPKIIHIVSYCEAENVASEDDVIGSSRLVRRAVHMFRENQEDLMGYVTDPIVAERREHLVNEAKILLYAIARLNGNYRGGELRSNADILADFDTLYEALLKGYMAAPGLISTKYKAAGDITTDVVEGGYVDCVDVTTGRSLSEAERIM